VDAVVGQDLTGYLRAARHPRGRPERASLGSQWGNIWPLLVLGVVAIPLGLAVFTAGERYAKRHGKLKRSG
jgi:hypothetical protein